MLTGRPNSARIKATIREGQMVASSDTLFSVGMEAMHRGGLGLSSGPEFLLKTAHRCFEVLLKHPDWQSPGKQVQLRLKIVDSLVPSILENSAMIETHLLKAMNLCKEAGLNDYLFQVYLLQAWLQLQLGHPPRCLSILKLAYTEAVELEMLQSAYVIGIKQCEVLSHQSNWPVCVQTLDQLTTLSSLHQHTNIQELFHILSAHYSLLKSAAFQSYQSSPSPASASSSHSSINFQHPVLKGFALFFKTVSLMKDGDYKEAPKILVELQEHVQALAADTATDELFLLEELPEGSLKLPRGILDLLHLLTYLVSGILHKMDDTTKSKMFLEEGLKVAALMGSSDWSAQVRFLFLRHLCEVHTMRSCWNESLECIDAQLELMDSLPQSLREVCEPMVCLDLAMMYQGQGNMEEAKVWLGGALKSRDVSVQLVSKMHLFLMSLEDSDKALEMANEIEGLLKSQRSSSPLTAGLSALVSGIGSMAEGSFGPSKLSLLESLKAADGAQSSQLKMVSLMLIGHLFMDTHGAQSEKMFTMALLFAQKAHSPHLVCLCADRLLSLLKRQEGVQDRIEQLESVRQEWIGRL